jgi:hypothetical protein
MQTHKLARAFTASVPVPARGKMQRRCSKCDAAPGWRCVAEREVDGVTVRRPLKKFHKER